MFQGSWWSFLFGGHLIHRLTLMCLMIMSVLVWFVIVERWLFLRRNRKESQFFMEIYSQAKDLQVLHRRVRSLPWSSAKTLFEKVYKQLSQMGAFLLQQNTSVSERLLPIERVVQSVVLMEKRDLNKRLFLLAIAAGVSPFLGLFGTVWGVIHAFDSLKQSQDILQDLAPGIAEALIATAVGLVPAIPALIAYRWIHEEAQTQLNHLKEFAFDLVNVVDLQIKVDQMQ
jgi:biopolymer transport protein TolQ